MNTTFMNAKYEMINGHMYLEKTVTIAAEVRRKGSNDEFHMVHWTGTSEEQAFDDLYYHLPTMDYEYRYLQKDYTGEGDWGEIIFEDDDKYCLWGEDVEDFLERYRDYMEEVYIELK